MPSRTRWIPLLALALVLVPASDVAAQMGPQACREIADVAWAPPEPVCHGDSPTNVTLPSHGNVQRELGEVRTVRGHPLLAFEGPGHKGKVELPLDDGRARSIRIDGLPAFDAYAVQFVPASAPNPGRAGRCLQDADASRFTDHTPAEEAGREADETLDGGTSAATPGVDLGEVSSDLRGQGVEQGEVRVYPGDAYCAALDATVRSCVGTCAGLEERVTSCAALACRFQTWDTATAERDDAGEGSVLLGPLVLSPGRWQVVRLREEPETLAGEQIPSRLSEVQECDNPVVVVCFRVVGCVPHRQPARQQLGRETCARSPEGAQARSPASPAPPCNEASGSQAPPPCRVSCRRTNPLLAGFPDASCPSADLDAERTREPGGQSRRCDSEETQTKGLFHVWQRCQRGCERASGSELLGRRVKWTVDHTGRDYDPILREGRVYDARSWSQQRPWYDRNECLRNLWHETAIASSNLAVDGRTKLRDPEPGEDADNWTLVQETGVRERYRRWPEYDDEKGYHERDVAVSTQAKKPALLLPDKSRTQSPEQCRGDGPGEDGECVRYELDPDVLLGGAFHSGGEREEADKAPKIARAVTCALLGMAASFVPGFGGLVDLGCTASALAELFEAENEVNYEETQDSFHGESGYECHNSCWYLENHLENDPRGRDRMAFGFVSAWDLCGDSSAEEYVAATHLKGLVHRSTHVTPESPTDNATGWHYWGKGLTFRNHVDLDLDAGVCT